MDLTVEDLRSELEKRGLDSEGDQKELQARFEQELEKENNEEKTLETSTEDSTEKNPESEDTTEKEDPVQKEEMVAIKEGEGDVVGNGAEVDKKADESEVQSLQTPSVEEASTEKEVEEEEVKTEEKEKEEVKTEEKEKEDEVKNEKDEEDEVKNEKDEEEKEVKEESSTSPTENAKGNDDPADDSNDTAADTKDSTADPSGTNTKSEENESFIVLVDDTQNDLDADLLSKEKATNKKSDAASAGSTTCKSGDGKEENASGGDKGKAADAKKTEKKADEKKDGKSKSSTAVHRLKSSKNASSGNPNSCNLWISGLSSNTKATNLKAVFTKYGKVVGAKIVTNARSPGARCYGFLTMSSSEEAAKCIQHLNQTELHGRMISVERAKTNPGLQPIKKVKPILKSSDKPEGKKSVQEEKSPNKKSTADKKTEEGNSSIKKSAEKKNVAGKSSDRKSDKTEPKKDGKGDSHSRQSPRSSSSKTKTPSKTSSRSPRRRHRSREGSSHISDRDYRMTSELRKRKSNLERIMQHQKRQIDHGRLVELELQRRQKKEAYMLERLREELRLEKEKLERKRMKLESAKQNQLWKERQEQEMLNGFERERQPVKRLYERKEAHSYSFWEAPKRPNLGSSSSRGGGGSASGTSASRFNRTISDETTWFSNHKETYDRRSDSYYNRDNKAMKPVSRFSDSNVGRINHAPQRSSHERYAPPESSSRLADHVSSDDRFERRDIGSGGYHGHDTDHRNLTADRGREIDRRSVSAHERLGGRIRNQPAGGTNWKSDSWSHSHGGIDSNHWVNNNMNSNYSNNAGSSGGFAGGSGTSSSGHGAQNMGASSMYYNVGQQSGMMSTGGGGNNMGSRMQEPRFDAYKNLEHGSMRRY